MTALLAAADAASLEAAVAGVRTRTGAAGAPAVQVAVVRRGEVAVADAWGERALGGGVAVGTGTLFHHGSCGKAWFALAVAAAARRGELDLDEPVRRWVPELELPDPVAAERVTLRDLLAHRSGLGRHDLVWILDPTWGEDQLLARLRHLPLAGGLRAGMSYSNLGYGLAAVAYARATGRTWSEGVARDAVAALRVGRATPVRDSFLGDADRAAPHLRLGTDRAAVEPRDLGAVAAAGGVALDAPAAAAWLRLQLDNGPDAAVTHVVAVGMDPALAPLPGLRLLGYGLGWVVATLEGRLLWWHSGNVDGFFTHVAVLPDDGVAASVCVNLQDATLTMPAALGLALAAAGQGAGWWPAPAADGGSDDAAVPGPREAGAAGDDPAPGPLPELEPAHPLDRYAGTYVDPGYGELVVSAEADGLGFRLGPSALPAAHRALDTWVLRYEPLEVTLTATFVTGPSAEVVEVRLVVDAGTVVTFRRAQGPA